MRPAAGRGPGQYGWGMGSQETALLGRVGNRQEGFRSGHEARMPQSPGPRRQLKAGRPLQQECGKCARHSSEGFLPIPAPTWLQCGLWEWQGSFTATQKKARSLSQQLRMLNGYFQTW